eukprot:75453-Chlamydomonas_euryale.AAC.1
MPILERAPGPFFTPPHIHTSTPGRTATCCGMRATSRASRFYSRRPAWSTLSASRSKKLATPTWNGGWCRYVTAVRPWGVVEGCLVQAGGGVPPWGLRRAAWCRRTAVCARGVGEGYGVVAVDGMLWGDCQGGVLWGGCRGRDAIGWLPGVGAMGWLPWTGRYGVVARGGCYGVFAIQGGGSCGVGAIGTRAMGCVPWQPPHRPLAARVAIPQQLTLLTLHTQHPPSMLPGRRRHGQPPHRPLGARVALPHQVQRRHRRRAPARKAPAHQDRRHRAVPGRCAAARHRRDVPGDTRRLQRVFAHQRGACVCVEGGDMGVRLRAYGSTQARPSCRRTETPTRFRSSAMRLRVAKYESNDIRCGRQAFPTSSPHTPHPALDRCGRQAFPPSSPHTPHPHPGQVPASTPVNVSRMWLAIALFGVMIGIQIAQSFVGEEWINLWTASLLTTSLMVLTRCMTWEQ